MARDPRIDAYIERAAPFAQPILSHVRELVHQACPGAQESIKWGMPSFSHAGGILCGMAAFKHHASFGFWKHALVVGEGEPRAGMGSYGKLATLADLPADGTLLAHIHRAVQLNEAGVRAQATRKATPKPLPPVPDDFAGALDANAAANAVFAAFPPGCKREYIDWITEARRADTRARRIAQAVEWIAEGKRRNWKYEAC